MSGNVVETLVGALVLAVAGAFLAFAYTSTDIGRIDGYRLSARFDRADGLTVGSDVRLSGIKVGTVTGQKLDPETYQAIVEISVRSDIVLPDDTGARIASESLLGGSYLSLEPGGSPDMLASGDEIEHTQGSVDLMGLIGQAIFSSADGGGAK